MVDVPNERYSSTDPGSSRNSRPIKCKDMYTPGHNTKNTEIKRQKP